MAAMANTQGFISFDIKTTKPNQKVVFSIAKANGFKIDCGDNSPPIEILGEYEEKEFQELSHRYADVGTYTVIISGNIIVYGRSGKLNAYNEVERFATKVHVFRLPHALSVLYAFLYSIELTEINDVVLPIRTSDENCPSFLPMCYNGSAPNEIMQRYGELTKRRHD